jgi:hypothetical protein
MSAILAYSGTILGKNVVSQNPRAVREKNPPVARDLEIRKAEVKVNSNVGLEHGRKEKGQNQGNILYVVIFFFSVSITSNF